MPVEVTTAEESRLVPGGGGGATGALRLKDMQTGLLDVYMLVCDIHYCPRAHVAERATAVHVPGTIF